MITKIRNHIWKIIFVDEMDDILLNKQGYHTAGVADNSCKTIYLSNSLKGNFLKLVLTHELVHAFSFEYNLSLSPQDEEDLANFIAYNGANIIHKAEQLLLLHKKINGIH